MWKMFEKVTDLNSGCETLMRRNYGVIEVEASSLKAIHLRPYPKLISQIEIWSLGWLKHRLTKGDRCRLYYNQPLSCPGFLSLQYVESACGSTLATFRTALRIFDEIAAVKRVGAVLCEASNVRISERLLERWGWERHCRNSPYRHYIKRRYDQL